MSERKSENKDGIRVIQAEIEAQHLMWEAEENVYTELPKAVRRRLLGYNYEKEGTTAQEAERKSRENLAAYQALMASDSRVPNAAPDVRDWRNIQGKSYVTGVKNQGSCGSCVSFATIGAIESIARVRAMSPDPSPVLPLLSEASLHFCAGRACEGWNLTSSFSYCKSTGVVPASYFPYTGVAQPCNPTPDWEKARTKIRDSHIICSIDEMIAWLAEKGPLATRFTVYDDFYSYRKGIYKKTPSASYEGGHAVLCVGYDRVNQAWICKNSWKKSWGEDGYFRIAMGECGIDASMYAIDTISPEYPLYMDVMLRDTFDDFGQAFVSGSVCKSPDIIPVGLNALSDPAGELKKQWFRDIGKDLTANANNVIYLRGISHNPKGTKARFYLYYSPASLLMYPGQWQNNQIPCSNGQKYYETEELKQGDLAVTKTPFLWNPSGIKGDHYCLIGRVVTDEHPNPIPKAEDVKEFSKFIAGNPNYCMRNISVVEKDIPDYSVAVQYEQGKLGARMHFIVESKGCSPDAEFSLSSTESAPSISIERQKVPKDGTLTGISSDVPRDFKTKLLLNFWNKNPEKAKNGWELSLKVFYIVEASDREEIPGIITLNYSSAGPEEGVVLGDYTIKAK